jgi:hypothetical protein
MLPDFMWASCAKEVSVVIGWLKRLRKSATVRRCRQCGTAVPEGEGMCPRCHGMDIEDGPVSGRQQREEASRERA